jgi:hypothetical protein
MSIFKWTFPRELGIKHRKMKRVLVENKEEFFRLIDRYNGFNPLYTNVMNLKCVEKRENGRIDYGKCEIRDRVFFDVDYGDPWEEANKLTDHFLRLGIYFKLVFSGNNFHFLLKIKPVESILTIRFFQISLVQEIEMEGFDFNATARNGQFIRITNTIHPKTRLHSIPLTVKLFKKGMKAIREAAKKRNFKSVIYGKKELDISEFTVTENNYEVIKSPVEGVLDGKSDLTFDQIIKEYEIELPKKIKGNMERMKLIRYLKNKGLYMSECNKVLGHYLPRNQYKKILEEDQLNYIYGNPDY